MLSSNFTGVKTNDATHRARGFPVISYQRFWREKVFAQGKLAKSIFNMTFFGLKLYVNLYGRSQSLFLLTAKIPKECRKMTFMTNITLYFCIIPPLDICPYH